MTSLKISLLTAAAVVLYFPATLGGRLEHLSIPLLQQRRAWMRGEPLPDMDVRLTAVASLSKYVRPVYLDDLEAGYRCRKYRTATAAALTYSHIDAFPITTLYRHTYFSAPDTSSQSSDTSFHTLRRSQDRAPRYPPPSPAWRLLPQPKHTHRRLQQPA